MQLSLAARLTALSMFVALAACGGGSTTVPAGVATAVPASTLSFTTIGGAPTTLSSTSQSVSLPTIAGVSAVGGADGDHVTLSAATSVNTVVSVASAATAGSSGGPPALQSFGRRAQSLGGVPVTPLYLVGITNTSPTQATVTIGTVVLGLGTLPPGSSVALACYDPSEPQNSWNQHCAFGPTQVSVQGASAIFTLNATVTLYPGATLWLAPYAYPTNIGVAPTPAPQVTPVAPTVTPPSSLTGTYIGSAQQTSGGGEASQYLEFSLTQTGSGISGTFAVLPSSANQGGAFGSLSGSVSGNVLTMVGTQQYGDGCSATTLTATLTGPLVAGTFSSPACGSGDNANTASSGVFSASLQSAGTLPTLSGTYSGAIHDSVNGAGTVQFAITPPGGTVFSGTATVAFPQAPDKGGTSAFVGFVVNATTAQFAIVGDSGGSGGGSCSPFGTLTLGGATLTGTYTNSGSGGGGNGSGNTCSATGSFTVSH